MNKNIKYSIFLFILIINNNLIQTFCKSTFVKKYKIKKDNQVNIRQLQKSNKFLHNDILDAENNKLINNYLSTKYLFWSKGYNGQKIRIGILDSGINNNISKCKNIIKIKNFTDEEELNDNEGHVTLARQLADRGYSKQDLIRYIYDANVLDYDRMTEEQREALREELRLENRLGRASMRPEDVKPGLHREPFSRPEHLMVFVSGSGSGQTQLYFTTSGSTAGLAEGIGQSRPWMTKAIRGAALTRYGR